MNWNIDLRIIFIILVFHGIGDYFLQTDKMKSEKYRDNLVLLTHTATYGAVLSLVNPAWGILNAAAHFSVDYVSSKFAKLYIKENDLKNFFRTIFLDQAIHVSILFLSWQVMGFRLTFLERFLN